MTEAERLLLNLVKERQIVLGSYLPPDGISAADAIDELFGLLDGPRAREAEAAAKREGQRGQPSGPAAALSET